MNLKLLMQIRYTLRPFDLVLVGLSNTLAVYFEPNFHCKVFDAIPSGYLFRW